MFVFSVVYSHWLVCIQLIMKDFFKCLEAIGLLPFVIGLCVPWGTASVFRQIWTLIWFSFKRTQSWPEVFPNHKSFFTMPTVLQKYMAYACTWCSRLPGTQWNFPKSPMDFEFNRYLESLWSTTWLLQLVLLPRAREILSNCCWLTNALGVQSILPPPVDAILVVFKDLDISEELEIGQVKVLQTQCSSLEVIILSNKLSLNFWNPLVYFQNSKKAYCQSFYCFKWEQIFRGPYSSTVKVHLFLSTILPITL